MRICRKCSVPLTLENQYSKTTGNICKPCHRIYVKSHSALRRKKDPEKVQAAISKSRLKKKMAVLNHYSGGSLKCLCGYDDIRALTIDHIDGGGTQHRASLGTGGGGNFYNWLSKTGYPDGYQVLCMNCQFIKEHNKKSASNNDI